MYKLFSVTKSKTNVLGFWKDESGKIFRDKIRIVENLNGLKLYCAKKVLFSQGEKSVFYIAEKLNTAIIENVNGQKQYLKHCITWKEKKLRPSLVKMLLELHGGLTIFKNKNDYILELWKE